MATIDQKKEVEVVYHTTGSDARDQRIKALMLQELNAKAVENVAPGLFDEIAALNYKISALGTNERTTLWASEKESVLAHELVLPS
jgi:hypothetical protein